MALVRWVMKPGGDYYDCSRCGCSCREDNLDVHEQYHEKFEGIVRNIATGLVEMITATGGRIPPEGYTMMGLEIPDYARSTGGGVRDKATDSEAGQGSRLRPAEQEHHAEEEMEHPTR